MIKRLIFDVDGTLIAGVDFTPAIQETLKKLNIYSEENVEKFKIGISTYENVFNNYNIKDYTNYMSKVIGHELPVNFIEIFFEHLKLAIPVRNENLINVIKKLSQKYEMVILTNYFRKSQMNRLNNMGIGQFFSECYGEELIKPNLNSYINACGTNKPDECIMIGDNIKLDIEYAKNAGLKTICVNSKNIQIENINTVQVQSVEDICVNMIENL